MPCYIGVIASFVTVVELLLEAYLPSLNDALGLYIPLIVVNCIIMGRAEAFAGKNPVIPSLFDGVGMGLGFTSVWSASVRCASSSAPERSSAFQIMPNGYEPINIFILAPGAFFVLALLIAIIQKVNNTKAEKAALRP
jgi:electron transport complex protein RnfE